MPLFAASTDTFPSPSEKLADSSAKVKAKMIAATDAKIHERQRSNNNWFVSVHGISKGPLPTEQLQILAQRKHINEDTLVSHDYAGSWTPAKRFPVLRLDQPQTAADCHRQWFATKSTSSALAYVVCNHVNRQWHRNLGSDRVDEIAGSR